MNRPSVRRPLAALSMLLSAALLAACGSLNPSAPQATMPPVLSAPPAPAKALTGQVAVKVLAINDFHGNLLPPAGGIKLPDPQNPGKTITLDAGGAERLATVVAQIKAKNPNHVFVAAGDLVGASPLLSALFHDESTIESLGLMGLDLSAVGNHEFDQGLDELLRKQRGGCHPKDGCKGPTEFKGAKYQYLAASTIDTRTGQSVLPAYAIKRFGGVPVGFIGLTLKGTPELVSPTGVAGLRFDDEAETVNRLIPELERQGVRAVVVLIHEGGVPVGGINDCPGISGPIVDIVKKLDKRVGLVVSGHTHRAYNCRIDGRLVTSGDKYGTLVTEIDLTLDRATGAMVEARADNVVVRPETAKDPRQTLLISSYQQVAQPLIERPVGFLAQALSKDGDDRNEGGGTTMGQLVADAMLAATRGPAQGGAQIAFTNIGGVRTGLVHRADDRVTYGDLFAALPFSNMLTVVEMNGTLLQRVLEEQWQNNGTKWMPLQLSQGFSYRWDARRPLGSRVVPGSMTLDGKPIAPNQTLRVAINSFLQVGGDGFVSLKDATFVQTGPVDVDALEAYFKALGSGRVQPTALDRAVRVDR
ncbi:bifunctional metallophosphatase/5'-nucleotidase [Mitsuaria sp. GD03876]|uniref:bifunctional metallophosphatase/5'-nucleotidase n=1 Tax=Mitsuaria sp. GD03876 TaxID=2975399 RepID=UPI00244CA020|nr:bifunctional metallophosphatase/5'-nucleotidase [Mitsuaria sp. GD03876]MDH0866821.1 bifunctional metallophosphatase/5'-nucleotidase [Mitsuaria sp. GD03876]